MTAIGVLLLLLGVAIAEKLEKWVIVTSISAPTFSIHKWLEVGDGWQVMVVGDLKTPEKEHQDLAAVHSHYHYVSVADQKELEKRFKVVPLLPWKTYQRKVAGYLIAIEKGAEVILETDDDNWPLLKGGSRDTLLLPEYIDTEETWIDEPEEINSGLENEGLSAENATNVYGCFGQPSLWPRGFPLSHLQWKISTGSPLRPPTEPCLRKRVRKDDRFGPKIFAPVQQGMQDKDPDVDAIFRLTHALEVQTGIFWQDGAPVVLPHGKWCPFNTQNTVVYKSAFWGLVLPVDVTFRETDIIRGWWFERILWDIGAHMLFRNATLYHDRNTHDYYKDFLMEEKLYTQTTKFLNFMGSWKSSATNLKDHIIQFALDLEQFGFWSMKNVELVKAWLADMETLGVKLPPLVRNGKGSKSEL